MKDVAVSDERFEEDSGFLRADCGVVERTALIPEAVDEFFKRPCLS